MLRSRKELYELAKKSYIRLLERGAERYRSDEVYVTVDHVGYECTRLEELFRPMWGIAPFLGDKDFCIRVGEERMRVSDYIMKVVSEGTDAENERRFDKNVTEASIEAFSNQCVTELAAYLVAVFFARDVLWEPLLQAEKDKVAAWIQKYAMIALRKSWPNNHYWYPVFCIEILRRLGYDAPDSEQYLQIAYRELEGLYVGHGRYCDGKQFGRFDYYEAWAHHTYTLLWILIADERAPEYEERCERYRARTSEFLRFYSHYFDVDGGTCAYGRSLSYRFAAVSVFGLAALTGCDVDLGLAKRIILKNIGYFYEKSIPSSDGCFGCGYLYESTRLAENYASDGASTCYTEGFMCLLAGEEHPLWTSEAAPLPIERGTYLVKSPVEGLGVWVRGDREHDGVTLFNNAMHYFQGRNMGFNDMCGYYSKFCYNSRAGFAISTRDKPSFDNMISLSTDDLTMCSLRGRIYPLPSDGDVLASYHVPFSNDPETRIVTYLLPLSCGYHVRVHRVVLSRPYTVREGGFCIGTSDDGYRYANGTLRYRDAVSAIDVIGSADTAFELQKIHPGMHNLRPLSYYPTWKTRVALDAGEYVFATTVFFSNGEAETEKPHVTLDGTRVTVRMGEKTWVIDAGREVWQKSV